MIDQSPSIELHGERFSPSEASRVSGLALSNSVEPGQLMTHGRYKDQPSPHGRGSIQCPKEVPNENRLAWLLDHIQPQLASLRECGAQAIELSISVAYFDQCNIEFSTSEIQSIAALGIPMSVTCWAGINENP